MAKRRTTMSSVGFAALGRTIIQNNRAQRSNKERALSLFSANKKWVDHKTATPELLEEIRQKMKRQQQRNKRRLFIAWIMILGILVGGMLYMIYT